MGEKLLDTVRIPKQIVIPAPWLLSMLAVGLINAGVVWREFQDLKDWQKTSSTTIAEIKERQIANVANVQSLTVAAQNHESRITHLERLATDRAPK